MEQLPLSEGDKKDYLKELSSCIILIGQVDGNPCGGKNLTTT